MNKIFYVIASSAMIFMFSFTAAAQDNSVAVNIICEYFVSHQGENSKVRIFKDLDDTYTVQVFWVENCLDKKGEVRLDANNPDKSLRKTPCDQIILIKGLTYDSKKQRWGDAKIYDPTRGIRANVSCEFQDGGVLKVKGTLACFSQSVYWKKI